MPDGDKVHDTLPGRWQPIYQQICEGHFGVDTLAHNAVDVLKKDIRALGRESLDIVIRVAEQLACIPPQPLLREGINWNELYQMVDRTAQSLEGNKRAKALAVRACKDQIEEIRYSAIFPKDLGAALMRKYVQEIYASNFAARSLDTEQHCEGVDHETVKIKLAEMWPYVEQEIVNLAVSVNQEGNISIRPRHRSLRQKEEIGLDTNLLQIGR